MKILILSCNTGGGHNAVASALRQCCRQRGVGCDVADSVSFLSSAAAELLGKMHTGVYRHMPRAFDKGYRMAEEHPSLWRRDTPVFRALTAGSERLYRHLVENGYDTVLCAHAFSALMMTAVVRRHPEQCFRTGFIATDYTCSPTVNQSEMDVYLLPDDSLAEEFVEHGIPRERLVGTGIPVREEFCSRQPRERAAEALGLPAGKKHLLVMCGSMGCGPVEKMTELLSRSPREDVLISVICGTNAALQRRLERKYGGDARIRIHGFVDNVSLLMDSADLYLTKPGGISVTEATVKALPMLLVDAVAGCEEYNLRYLLTRGMAQTAKTPEELTAHCLSLLDDADTRAHMIQQLTLHAHPDAAEHILDVMAAIPKQEEVSASCGSIAKSI